MLLVINNLNNNNTEFVWWVVVSNPYCGQTNFYLLMVELGFDNLWLFRVYYAWRHSQEQITWKDINLSTPVKHSPVHKLW